MNEISRFKLNGKVYLFTDEEAKNIAKKAEAGRYITTPVHTFTMDNKDDLKFIKGGSYHLRVERTEETLDGMVILCVYKTAESSSYRETVFSNKDYVHETIKDLEGGWYKVRGEFLSITISNVTTVTEFADKVESDISDFKQNVESGISDFKQNVESNISDFKQNVESDISDFKQNVEETLTKVRPTAKLGEIILTTSGWIGEASPYSQVVEIDGVTENSQVDLTPSVNQLAVFYNKDLAFVTENDNGVVTVYAIGQKPQNDYTIQVTITEVDV